MPEPDDNSQSAAYLTKTIHSFRPPAEGPSTRVWLNVYETPGNRSYQAECPAEFISDPDLVRGWASEELKTVGLRVDTWETAPGLRTWDDGEYDYRAVGLDTLPSELPSKGSVWVSCTAVTWGPVVEEFADGPVEEHGWIQPGWRETDLYENRDDVAPIYTGTNPDEAAKYIRDYLGSVDEPERGRGSFYGSEPKQSPESATAYHYACHAEGWSPDQVARIEQQVQHPGRALTDSDAQVHPVFNPHQQSALTAQHAQIHHR